MSQNKGEHNNNNGDHADRAARMMHAGWAAIFELPPEAAVARFLEAREVYLMQAADDARVLQAAIDAHAKDSLRRVALVRAERSAAARLTGVEELLLPLLRFPHQHFFPSASAALPALTAEGGGGSDPHLLDALEYAIYEDWGSFATAAPPRDAAEASVRAFLIDGSHRHRAPRNARDALRLVGAIQLQYGGAPQQPQQEAEGGGCQSQ